MKKSMAMFLAAAALATLSAAARASEIHVAIGKPLVTFDPHKQADAVTSEVLSQVYETPLRYTPDHPDGAPNLFSAVQRVDPQTSVGTVAPGIVFSDGTPLNAERMAAWLAGVPDIASRARVTPSRTAGHQTVTFRLKAPDRGFASILMMNYSCVALAKGKGAWVGTGPFVIESHDERRIVLARNPRFREVGEPKVDRLYFDVYPAAPDGTNPGLVEAIRRGAVDFTDALPLSALPELQRLPGARAIVLESKNTGWISFNLRRPPLTDVRLRRAIAALIDPSAIVGRLYPMGTRLATGALPPALSSQVSGVDFDTHLRPDPSGARRELEAAGYSASHKLRLTLLVPWTSRPYCNNPVLFGSLVRQQLEGSGAIEVHVVQPATGDAYFNDLLHGRFDLAGNGWIADGPNPADFIEANFSSKKINCLSDCNNMAAWSDAAVDRAIGEIRATGSASAYGVVADALRKEVPVVPVVHGPGVMVVSNRLHGVEPTTFSYISFRSASLSAP